MTNGKVLRNQVSADLEDRLFEQAIDDAKYRARSDLGTVEEAIDEAVDILIDAVQELPTIDLGTASGVFLDDVLELLRGFVS